MFSSPIRQAVTMQRPLTANRKAGNTNYGQESPKKSFKKKPQNLSSLVRKGDRFKPAEMIEYL